MLPRALLFLTLSLVSSLSARGERNQHILAQSEEQSIEDDLQEMGFTLRHIHVTTNDSQVLFADIPSSSESSLGGDSDPIPSHSVATRKVRTHRPRLTSNINGGQSFGGWDEVEVEAPDVTSRSVLLELAKMTFNAYFEVGDKLWYDVSGNWNVRRSFFLSDPELTSITGYTIRLGTRLYQYTRTHLHLPYQLDRCPHHQRNIADVHGRRRRLNRTQ
jgi:hypothetical protein